MAFDWASSFSRAGFDPGARPPARRSLVLIGLAACLAVVFAVAGAIHTMRPVTLRIAVGPPGSDDAKVIQTLSLGRKNAAEKVASFLYLIATHIDPTEDEPVASFDLPLSRADIGDFLGLTIETVSRTMTKLRRAGAIDLDDVNVVRIKSEDVLRALAGEG